MLKLYKRVKEQLHYHEAWASGKEITEHWGLAGKRGNTRDHRIPKGVDPERAIQDVLKKPAEGGYQPIPSEEHAVLMIEYRVEGFGSPKEMDFRHALQGRMDETLGWTGLGHCDGGSSGSGTMEVCCMVVDFDIAKQVIEEDLKKSEFREFSRIYREDE